MTKAGIESTFMDPAAPDDDGFHNRGAINGDLGVRASSDTQAMAWPAGTFLLNPEGFRHSPFLGIKADSALTHFRRTLDRLIAEERQPGLSA